MTRTSIPSNVDEQSTLTRPLISAHVSPLEVITAPTRDGHTATAVVRKPPGTGPFPAIIYLHGGLESRPVEWLQENTFGETLSRFLAAGYITVSATFRSRRHDPLTEDALRDCLAIVAYVKQMPGVDPLSVVIWGDSGGGSLALEVAGEATLCAIAVQEPASVLLTGMFSKENIGGEPPFDVNRGRQIMADPRRFYTPELQERTRTKIRKIGCPVFIAYGDVHPINKINHEIVIPELQRAKKSLEVILYPGEKHGFSRHGTPQATLKFFRDCDTFFRKYLATQPVALDQDLVEDVPVERDKPPAE